MEPASPEVGTWSLNHWIAREDLWLVLLILKICYLSDVNVTMPPPINKLKIVITTLAHAS